MFVIRFRWTSRHRLLGLDVQGNPYAASCRKNWRTPQSRATRPALSLSPQGTISFSWSSTAHLTPPSAKGPRRRRSERVHHRVRPGNPAADEKGMVKRPKCHRLIELENNGARPNRSYEANLQTFKQHVNWCPDDRSPEGRPNGLNNDRAASRTFPPVGHGGKKKNGKTMASAGSMAQMPEKGRRRGPGFLRRCHASNG